MIYNYLGFKLSNPMHVTFIIENIFKITKYENMKISDFFHISSNDISFLKFAKLKENKKSYMIIIFHKVKIFFIYWYFY
jgi:hypothetical protein